MITKTITVTEKHIRTGVPCDARECPIAKAFRAAGLRNVMIGYEINFNGKLIVGLK
jgi:hypothetical protein